MSDTLPNEVIARALYAEEKRRAEHANALIGATGECIEPYEECADSCWRNDADAALSALEAAGWEVNRKGTLELVAKASELLRDHLEQSVAKPAADAEE